MQILAVVIRYETPLLDSNTIQGLCDALLLDPELAEAYSVFVWDNSPEPLFDPQLPIRFEYHHSEANLGISGACNAALDRALMRGNTWMLLLDQDSTVTAEFLRKMLDHSKNLSLDLTIAAIAPTVKMGPIIASPKQRGRNGNSHAYPRGECGVASGEAFAVNSGALIRAEALSGIGGYSTDFWLDYSDIDVFHRFYLQGKKIWRAADIELEHEMTAHDYDRLMQPWRYRNFSFAETAFFDLYAGWQENTVQHLRLLARALKQKIKYKNPAFWRITLEQFFYRIRVSRKERLERWRIEGECRRNVKRTAGTVAVA